MSLAALHLPQAVLAQGTIEGTVLDANSEESIPGVQVVVRGTQLGSVTNAQGRYEIEGVPAGEQTVEARFIGYRSASKDVTVVDGETATLDFAIRESVVDLDEVVVTGTGGPVEKRKLGNSIATINVAKLETAPVQSFSEVIQGREPGLVGLPSGGLSGEGTRIRIRGSASLSQSNEPLVYVDGVRINNGGGFGGYVDTGGGGSPSRLDDINPEAIARVEVLKGAAAATLFGTEASNGVIQIFTKTGQQGPARFTFSTELTGIRYPDAYPDQVGFARTQEQADRVASVIGGSLQPYELVRQNIPEDLVGTGYGQSYSASVSGGAEGITYFVSGRFLGENGPFQQTFIRDPGYAPGTVPLSDDRVRRSQGTATLNITPGDLFQVRLTTGYSDSFLSTLQTNNNIYGTISLAQFSKPELIGPNNRSGTIAFATVNESLQQTVEQDAKHFYSTLNLAYQPLEALALDGTFGLDFVDVSSEMVRPFGWNIDGFASDTPQGEKAFTESNSVQLTFDTKGKLQNQIGERFTSDLTVGAQGFFTRTLLESGLGTDFPGPGFEVTEAAAQQSIIESFGEVVNLGIFAQDQFGFDDYLFLTAGARYDVNSAFGSEFSGVFYPKASLSFIPSDAPFWAGSVGPLSSVRLRAAVGQAGLQPGAFAALTTFGSLSSVNGAGIVPENLGNADLKPEVSTEYEVGGELGFFDDRAVLETTYWNRKVSDAIVSRQFVPTGGFRDPQAVNIGALKAQGLELAMNAVLFEREGFAFDVFANASYLWEQVTDLGDAPPIKVGGSYPRYRNYLVEGFAPGAHFGVQLQDVPDGSLPVDFNGDGQPDTEAQILEHLAGLTTETASLPSSTATVLIATAPNTVDSDGDGVPDTTPTRNSRDFYLGKPTPDWQGAFGFNVDFFRHFSLGTLFEYKTGNYYINNLTDAFRQSNASIGRNLPESARVERDYITGGVDASGTPQNDPEVRLEALREWLGEQLALAPFSGLNTIKPADYVRFRELSLTYRVPQSFVGRYGANSLAFTIAGRNLALWTRYDGVDPELNAVGRGGGDDQLDNNFLDGVEAFGFPVPRRVTFKVRVGF